MKVWITKYALSTGVYCAAVNSLEPSSIISIKNKNGLNGFSYFHGEGKDWHRTEESAIARANDMRNKKILSMKKQIERLAKMQFDVEE